VKVFGRGSRVVGETAGSTECRSRIERRRARAWCARADTKEPRAPAASPLRRRLLASSASRRPGRSGRRWRDRRSSATTSERALDRGRRRARPRRLESGALLGIAGAVLGSQIRIGQLVVVIGRWVRLAVGVARIGPRRGGGARLARHDVRDGPGLDRWQRFGQCAVALRRALRAFSTTFGGATRAVAALHRARQCKRGTRGGAPHAREIRGASRCCERRMRSRETRASSRDAAIGGKLPNAPRSLSSPSR
jgi:hypothetical protein